MTQRRGTDTSESNVPNKFYEVADRLGGLAFEDYLPESLAKTLDQLANALSVPRAGLLPVLLTLAATFSDTSYGIGPSGKMEAVQLFLPVVGSSGTNKSGLEQLLLYTLRKVVAALLHISKNPELLFKEQVMVAPGSVPVEDHTATPAAALQKQSQNRNVLRAEDEWVTLKRAFNNGASNSSDGMQHTLKIYNGVNVEENELKSGTERMIIPRYNLFFNIQPEPAASDFGEGSTAFDLGFTSRCLWTSAVGNFASDEIRPGLSSSAQTLIEIIAAIAGRSAIVHGSWEDREDAAKSKKTSWNRVDYW